MGLRSALLMLNASITEAAMARIIDAPLVSVAAGAACPTPMRGAFGPLGDGQALVTPN